ncbi:hypothetical protein [Paenibacillus segetis]|uniref:DUF4303 domain-containing protein n=1 Tax=Paenibacillus segetis TaxID=1325360 RepID=A0ABQ1YIQ6_9BACL|nr:hypothetical protein [Paenibacillus segetis]GGH27754.1 hypothetical protein GCM10008013_29370 [Paenibacillus segetis]
MKYYDLLNSNKDEFQNQIEHLLQKHRVQPVGYGYIDCILMINNLDQFVSDLSSIGILISDVSWWCYVDPNQNLGCPHGMGGPTSDYYDGWFSELQNDMYDVDKEIEEPILDAYDKQLIARINELTTIRIREILKEPFRYTPTEYIEENKCVVPALWLLVPDDWKRTES